MASNGVACGIFATATSALAGRLNVTVVRGSSAAWKKNKVNLYGINASM
jgi:hypothetical protein